MASDPTMDFLSKLADESQWSIRRGVPIFKTHKASFPAVPLKNGQTIPARTNEVTEATLNEIVSNMRQAEAGGTLCTLQIGHINQDPLADETQQPPVGGVYRNARVGRYGPQQEPAILADEYLLREYEPVRRNFPHRSAEYYHGLKTIKAVAILTRPGQLELGMVGMQCGEFPFLYAMGPDMAGEAIGPNNATMPEAKKDGDEFTPEQKSMYEGMRRYMCKTYGLDESWPGAAKPAAPDPTKPAPPADAEKKEEVTPMQSQQLATLYQQNAALNARLDGLTLEREHERCQAMLYQLHAEGFRLSDEDKADELKALAAKPAADRAAYISRLRKRYEYTKVPGAEPIHLYQGQHHEGGGATDANDPTAKPWYHDAAMNYMLAKPGTQYETACAYIQSTQAKK